MYAYRSANKAADAAGSETESRMNTRLNGIIKKTALFALAAAVLAACFLTACREKTPAGDDGVFPNESQTAAIMSIAEAFYEYGEDYDQQSALPISKVEQFIAYLFNDELTADESGFSAISADEADVRVKAYFDISPVLRTYKRSGVMQELYFQNNKYFIRVRPSAAEKTEIVSTNELEGGDYEVRVNVNGTDGGSAQLRFVFRPTQNGVLVMSCERFDGK